MRVNDQIPNKAIMSKMVVGNQKKEGTKLLAARMWTFPMLGLEFVP